MTDDVELLADPLVQRLVALVELGRRSSGRSGSACGKSACRLPRQADERVGLRLVVKTHMPLLAIAVLS